MVVVVNMTNVVVVAVAVKRVLGVVGVGVH